MLNHARHQRARRHHFELPGSFEGGGISRLPKKKGSGSGWVGENLSLACPMATGACMPRAMRRQPSGQRWRRRTVRAQS